MKRNHRVAALFPLVLLVSMVGFGGYETHTNESTHVIVEVVEAAFGATPLMAQNGEGTCRSCVESNVGENYRHWFTAGGSCGGGDPEAVQQSGPGGFCRECDGALVEACESGHECCHTNKSDSGPGMGCDSHSPCSPGGGPDPDFSPLELAHHIDRMIVGIAQASGSADVTTAVRALARVPVTEPGVSFTASVGGIELYGCLDAASPTMVWRIPEHLRDIFTERHRVALREG